MRLLYFLFIYILLLPFVFSGCSGTAKTNNPLVAGQDNDSKFPAFLVGTWRAEYMAGNTRLIWQFTFDCDGSVATMNHYFISVPVIVAEGGVVEELKGNASATYALGPIDVNYDQLTRKLDVTINIENFRIEFPDGVGEGCMMDSFVGSVSKDGTIWQVDWYNHLQFADEPEIPPSPEPFKQLVFYKITKPQEK